MLCYTYIHFPRSINNILYDCCVWLNIVVYYILELTVYNRPYYIYFDESRINCLSYVYWTVHHFDIWIKRDQLDVTCFFISLFNVQHVSDVNTSILRRLRLICGVISWIVLFWYNAWVLRCGLAVVVWYPAVGWSTTVYIYVRITGLINHSSFTVY